MPVRASISIGGGGGHAPVRGSMMAGGAAPVRGSVMGKSASVRGSVMGKGSTGSLVGAGGVRASVAGRPSIFRQGAGQKSSLLKFPPKKEVEEEKEPEGPPRILYGKLKDYEQELMCAFLKAAKIKFKSEGTKLFAYLQVRKKKSGEMFVEKRSKQSSALDPEDLAARIAPRTIATKNWKLNFKPFPRVDPPPQESSEFNAKRDSLVAKFPHFCKFLSPVASKPRLVKHGQLLRFIYDLYNARYEYDGKVLQRENPDLEKGRARQLKSVDAVEVKHFPRFTFEFSKSRYGMRSLVGPLCWGLLHSIEHFCTQDASVELFSKFLSEEYGQADLLLLLYCLDICKRLFASRLKPDDNSYSRKTVPPIFRLKVDEMMCLCVVNIVFRDAQELADRVMKRVRSISACAAEASRPTSRSASPSPRVAMPAPWSASTSSKPASPIWPSTLKFGSPTSTQFKAISREFAKEPFLLERFLAVIVEEYHRVHGKRCERTGTNTPGSPLSQMSSASNLHDAKYRFPERNASKHSEPDSLSPDVVAKEEEDDAHHVELGLEEALHDALVKAVQKTLSKILSADDLEGRLKALSRYEILEKECMDLADIVISCLVEGDIDGLKHALSEEDIVDSSDRFEPLIAKAKDMILGGDEDKDLDPENLLEVCKEITALSGFQKQALKLAQTHLETSHVGTTDDESHSES